MQSKEITKAEANILGKNLSYFNPKNDANNTQNNTEKNSEQENYEKFYEIKLKHLKNINGEKFETNQERKKRRILMYLKLKK